MANGIFVPDASAKHLNESSGFLMVAVEWSWAGIQCGLDLHMARKIGSSVTWWLSF